MLYIRVSEVSRNLFYMVLFYISGMAGLEYLDICFWDGCLLFILLSFGIYIFIVLLKCGNIIIIPVWPPEDGILNDWLP